jgi:hypothetical protein
MFAVSGFYCFMWISMLFPKELHLKKNTFKNEVNIIKKKQTIL